MWPFGRKRKSRSDDAGSTIDQAILFVAQRWPAFSASVPQRPGTPMRERVALFARTLDSSLHRRFPALAAASEQVMLLIIAKGIEQSGAFSRDEIERELGILLPP